MNRHQVTRQKLDKLIIDLSKTSNNRFPSERELMLELGVSRATVARLLNEFALQGRIVRHHGSGTFLNRAQKNRNGIVLAVAMRYAYQNRSEHFKSFLEEIYAAAEKQNTYIQLYDRLIESFQQFGEHAPLLDAIRNGSVDGVLILSRMPLGILDRLNSLTPIVIVNNPIRGIGLSLVTFDECLVGQIAVQAMLSAGSQHIGFYAPIDDPSSYPIYVGMREEMRHRGINSFSPDNVFYYDSSNGFQPDLFLQFIQKNKINGLLVFSPFLRRHIIEWLKSVNLRSPGDIFIISIGNYANLGPEFEETCIDTNAPVMASSAINLLCKLINHELKAPFEITIEPRLVEYGK